MLGQRFAVLPFVVLGLFLTGCVDPPVESPTVAFESPGTQPLKIGAAAREITPQQIMTIAGGVPYQISLGVHDPLWARAVVFDNGSHRIALVSVDLIGIDYDDVSRARQQVGDEYEVDYVLVAATHTHHGPDVIGAWSPTPFDRDGDYKQFMTGEIAAAVEEAAQGLQAAELRVVQGSAGDPPLARDSRPPVHIPDELTVWQAIARDTGETIATAVHFASHPILVGSAIPEISSDFPHYLRDTLENGRDGDSGLVGGFGGVALYFNGSLGGRITPANADPLANPQETNPLYQAAEAYGYRLAERAIGLLADASMVSTEQTTLAAKSEAIQVPIDNPLLRVATEMLLIRRPIEDGITTSEVGIVQIGPLELFAVPGMPFPESWDGSAASIEGSDFTDEQSGSSLRTLSAGEVSVVVGLGNDLLGYIIPRSLWDATPPFSTGGGPPYGEMVSPGPETEALIQTAFQRLAD